VKAHDPTSPADPYRWVILTVGVVAQASFAAVFFGLPVLAPDLQAHYDLSLAEVGAVLASINVGALVSTLPWGLLADHIGERAVTALGLSVAAVAIAAAAKASGFHQLLAALFLVGVFGASVQSASGRAVMRWFPASRRGFALGIRQTAIPIGGAVAALTLPRLVHAGGVRAALLALAAALLVSAIAGGIWLRSAAGGEHLETRIADVFRDRRLWRLSSGSGLLLATQAAVLGFTVLFLHEERGFSTTAAAAVFAVIQVVGAVLRIQAGHWSDRRGDRIGPLLRLGLALTASVALTAALLDAPTVLLLPILVVAGALSLSWNGLSFTAAAELGGPARAGAALGLQQTTIGAASAVTPLVFATTVDATSWTVGFALAAAAALGGTAIVRGLSARPPLESVPARAGGR
jgi:sugar phosphate permease